MHERWLVDKQALLYKRTLNPVLDFDVTRPRDSDGPQSWEDLSYGTCQQVPGGASGAGGADGR